MFGFFKRNKVQALIKKIGLEGATNQFSDMVLSQLQDKTLLRQLILVEVEGASLGNETAQAFARDSGIPPQEYKGALTHSIEEIDGPGGAKTFLDDITMQLMPDRGLMVRFRLMLAEQLLVKGEFGKYSAVQKIHVISPMKLKMRQLLLDEAIMRQQVGVSRVFDYERPGIGRDLLTAFGESLALACVTGVLPISVSRAELNEFCNHMGAAALFDDPVGVAFSCFAVQGGSFAQFLPIPIQEMSDEALDILATLLLHNRAKVSQSGIRYVEENWSNLEERARAGNRAAALLVAD
ncbi:MAG: hypothetical protein KKC24_08605 [Gammaproteobacteria bacterium]|nr:hypothetical protein [Gammaproteobacteria bacterium]MBU0818897.1 hypothetical protein [Gammaproteobacteria bacterium]MBU0844301.1 hypothetical protein [Gammaproteobacteria bacterium]MBU1843544.1 hypothetical protein [Gammaproteobacteria bacterium]